MIDPQLLGLLVCPVTKQPLRDATAAELAAVNRLIAAGTARNRGSAVVTAPWAAALATADGRWLYPIQDEIPILLPSEAVPAPS